MTAHVLELISAARDEPLDRASEASLREHLISCSACRAFARHVEIVDAAIRRPETVLRVPAWDPLASAARRGSGLGLVFVAVVVLVVITVIAGAAGRERRVPAQPERAPIGSSLGGVRLGADADAVTAALGRATRTSADGRQWVYGRGNERGIVVFFDGAPDESGHVYRVTTIAAFGPGAREGIAGNTPGALGRFVGAYTGYDVIEVLDGSAGPPSMDRWGPGRILTVTGRGDDGEDVTVWAVFSSTNEPTIETSRTLFRGAPARREIPTLGEVIDPFAIDPCQVMVRAAPRAGYEPYGSVWMHNPGGPGWLAEARICAYGPDNSWTDPHLILVARPVSAAEARSLVASTVRLDAVGSLEEWRPTGLTWVSEHRSVGEQAPCGPAPDCRRPFAAVAVSIEPYFFIVTAATEDQASRLAEATRAILTTRR